MPSESKDEDKPKSRLRPKVVLLNASKREAFAPNSGFKRLFRRLRSSNYKPVNNRDDITAKLLEEADVLVTACPREKFTGEEIEVIQAWLKKGGSLFCLSAEGGEEKLTTGGDGSARIEWQPEGLKSPVARGDELQLSFEWVGPTRELLRGLSADADQPTGWAAVVQAGLLAHASPLRRLDDATLVLTLPQFERWLLGSGSELMNAIFADGLERALRSHAADGAATPLSPPASGALSGEALPALDRREPGVQR